MFLLRNNLVLLLMLLNSKLSYFEPSRRADVFCVVCYAFSLIQPLLTAFLLFSFQLYSVQYSLE